MKKTEKEREMEKQMKVILKAQKIFHDEMLKYTKMITGYFDRKKEDL